MHKTPGAMPGVSVHLGGEHKTPNPNRPRLQANARMAARLKALLWAWPRFIAPRREIVA